MSLGDVKALQKFKMLSVPLKGGGDSDGRRMNVVNFDQEGKLVHAFARSKMIKKQSEIIKNILFHHAYGRFM